MFDDIQPKNPGSVPPNLPVGEPEDIFEKEPDETPAGVMPSAPVSAEDVQDRSPLASGSALDAGMLRPKQPPSSGVGTTAAPRGPYAVSGGAEDVYKIKEPSIGKGIVITVVLAIMVVVLGGGGWWLYVTFVMQKSAVILPASSSASQGGGNTLSQPAASQVSPGVVEPASPVSNTVSGDTINADVVDDQVLFGQPVDSDSDGLDDVREKQLNTDPRNWDTDGDGLSDGDEVLGWKTDPLNKDTDGDGYPDGLEVQGGYNPNGPGKFIQPPTTTPPVQ